jgi:replicative DNA helicase
MKSLGNVLESLFNQIDYVLQHRGEVVGVATGFSDLDQLTAGFQPSDLIIVAARPSMGKTSLALGMAYGAAVGHGKTVGIFSLEMSAEQLVQRVLSMETGVDTHRLRLGQIDDNEWERISRAFGRLSEAPLFFKGMVTATVADVRSKAEELKAEKGLDMLIIDQLQSVSASHTSSRLEERSEISRELKGLARDLKVPVVVVSQISSELERRADRRPQLCDLRDSGSIEEEADIVLFVYREDLYEEDSGKRGVAEIIVAKHRNGPVGSINLRFFDRTARFADLELYPVP